MVAFTTKSSKTVTRQKRLHVATKHDKLTTSWERQAQAVLPGTVAGGFSSVFGHTLHAQQLLVEHKAE